MIFPHILRYVQHVISRASKIYKYIGIGRRGGGRKKRWGHIHRHRETCTWKMESMVFHNYDLDFAIPTHVRCPHNNNQMQLAEFFPFLPHFLNSTHFFFFPFLFFLHIYLLSLQLHQINMPFLALRSESMFMNLTWFINNLYIYIYMYDWWCFYRYFTWDSFLENKKILLIWRSPDSSSKTIYARWNTDGVLSWIHGSQKDLIKDESHLECSTTMYGWLIGQYQRIFVGIPISPPHDQNSILP